MMATRGWKVVQAHVPMIRFRKGGTNPAIGGATATRSAAPGTTMKSGGPGSTGPGAIALPVIEDFQLPLRFQRRPIDPNEIEYINRGGPE
ncbi:28S ribosomal protein S36, mitochondrial [Venturia canescens]|uniref:28S ribosomal protein S36, mitochondrial n=1 Tax=Venturia canescens TaxID=32260 RepID=UPI001C9C04B6|nr:28S ribosomal protein S36, mitochondrial [Venturia canescens]